MSPRRLHATRSIAALAVLSLAPLTAACSDSIAAGTAPAIEVFEGATSVPRGGIVSVPNGRAVHLSVRNSGSGDLLVGRVELTGEPASAFIVQSWPLNEPVRLSAGEARDLLVVVNDSVAEARPSGTLVFHTNTTIDGRNRFQVRLTLTASAPRLLVQPTVVDFETVAEGSIAEEDIVLLNTGAAPLQIDRVMLAGHPGFGVTVDDVFHELDQVTASLGVSLDPPLTIAAGEAKTISTAFRSTDAEAAEGRLTLLSNDPSAIGGTVVELLANTGGPWLDVRPSSVDFGGKIVGQTATIDLELAACGDENVAITQADLLDDTDGAFGVGAEALPRVLAPGDSLKLKVSYVPTHVAPIVDALPVLQRARLRLEFASGVSPMDVPLSGFGADGSCPTAVIRILEGEEVVPQTLLHLSGSESTASTGAVTGYEWSVQQPGTATAFLPSRYVAEPTFSVDVAGEYHFELRVFDSLGVESCDAARATVFVVADQALHVELLWTTPGDIDESDTGFDAFGWSLGSDVDLHVAHPLAIGADVDLDGDRDGWFDPYLDVFWNNAAPNWGGAGSNDDPRLDRDDTDGAGPENFNLAAPEVGATYRVAAHYWDDWGFGRSDATVRVYVHGEQRFEWAGTTLHNYDLWDVCSIAWPSGVVTAVDDGAGGPRITSNPNITVLP